MRLLLASLALVALCACPPPVVTPPPSQPGDVGSTLPGSDDGGTPPLSPDAGGPGRLEVTFPLTVVQGGSTFGVVSNPGGTAVSGLAVEGGPDYLTITLESDAVQPGKSVLLRIDAQAGAQRYTDAAVGAPVTFRVSGTSEGARVEAEGSVSVLRESDFSGRCLNALVHPSRVDVSAGVPVTVKAIVFPCARVRGTLSFHATSAGLCLPAVQFDPPRVEVDGLAPVVVQMTVGGDLRLPEDSRVELEVWLNRSKAISVPFDLVTLPPEPPVEPPILIGQQPPDDLYLRPGTSVPLDLAGPDPALKFTAWEVFDLPAGISATAVNGVVTFAVAAGAPAGAHHIRLKGTREGHSQEWKVRLLVARVDGDWPLLGDSPTQKNAQGYGSPGPASIAVDAAGTVHVACALNDVSKQDLRAFQGGQWQVVGEMPDCRAPSFDSASGGNLLCAAAVDATYKQAVASCGSSLLPPGGWPRLPAQGLAHLLGGDVLVTLEGVDDRATLYRWNGVSSWAQVAQMAVPQATLLDVAPLQPGGLLLATMELEDKLTPTGWAKRQVIDVERLDGAAVWTALGDLGSETEFDSNEMSTFPFADPRQAVELEAAPDGSPVVAWIDTSDERIHASTWNGTQWQPLATALAPTPGFFAYELKLEIDGAGQPVLAWLEAGFPESEWSGGRMDRRPCHVRVHRLGAAGWEELSPAPLNLDAAGPARNVSLALDATGRPHVSWEEAGSIFVARSSR